MGIAHSVGNINGIVLIGESSFYKDGILQFARRLIPILA
jgi:hypothetical protein